MRSIASEFAQDIGGALLFGMPLVYTMEVWWLGQRSDLVLTASVVAVVALAAAGMRHAVEEHCDWVLALGVGLRSATLGLLLAGLWAFILGIVTLDSSAAEALGIVGAVGVPLTLGSVLGHVLFSSPSQVVDGGSTDGGDDGDDGGDGEDGSGEEAGRAHGMLHAIFASALGAAFLALPIAPTDEVPMVAAHLDGWRAIAVVVAAAVACYVVLIASGFLEQRTSGPGIETAEALALTCIVVTVGFVMAVVLLIVGGKLPFDAPSARAVGNICALSVPAVIGAAAGRLAAA